MPDERALVRAAQAGSAEASRNLLRWSFVFFVKVGRHHFSGGVSYEARTRWYDDPGLRRGKPHAARAVVVIRLDDGVCAGVCRRLDWLHEALQWAIELEFATVPTYLCGMWSIIDGNHPVRGYFQSIVLQEMAHMGLACNLMTTLGGTPNLAGRTPQFPGPLPGGVRPELVVEIAFSDVQASPQYPGGMALRFARVKRYREDKTAAEADTIDSVRKIFEGQR